jgi:protein SCO1/2
VREDEREVLQADDFGDGWYFEISAPAAAQDKNSSVAVAASRPQAAPVLTKSDVVTIYALTDGSRTPVSRKSFKGRFSLIVFGYTACPDVCPTSMTHVASVMEQLGPHADYVLPVFVTFDLVRDTAEVLADYVSHSTRARSRWLGHLRQ